MPTTEVSVQGAGSMRMPAVVVALPHATAVQTSVAQYTLVDRTKVLSPECIQRMKAACAFSAYVTWTWQARPMLTLVSTSNGNTMAEYEIMALPCGDTAWCADPNFDASLAWIESSRRAETAYSVAAQLMPVA